MRLDRAIVLLDAAQSVEDGTRRVARFPGVHYVVLRRTEGTSVYWYTFRIDRFLHMVQAQAPDISLKHALDLHEYTAVPASPEGSTVLATNVPGAVVIGAAGRVLGVLEIELMAPPTSQEFAAPVILSHPPAIPAEPPPQPATQLPDAIGEFLSREAESESGGGGTAAEYPASSRRSKIRGRDVLKRMARALVGSVGRRLPKLGQPARPFMEDSEERGSRAAPEDIEPTSGQPHHDTGSYPIPGGSPPPVKNLFKAEPDIVAPDSVLEGDIFVVEVGFAAERRAGVVSSPGPIVIAEAPPEFDLHLQLAAVGFEALEGWSHDLHVNRDNPQAARLVLHFRAEHLGEALDTRTIVVQYYFGANLCGQAQRSIVVARFGVPASDVTRLVAMAPAPGGVGVVITPNMHAPDLTVTIRLATGRANREAFQWSFASPHAVTLPDASPVIEFDSTVAAFVDEKFKSLLTLSKAPTGDNEMRGFAKDIRDVVPSAFWMALTDVTAAIAAEHRAPDVLFVTEETRVPWELAWVTGSAPSAADGHLGAQVNIGRWLLGREKPALPPPDELSWLNLGVVVGTYAASTGLALPDAVQEAQAIAALYPNQATSVQLDGAQLDQFLDGSVPTGGCQVMHFACHGQSRTDAPANSALLMQNQEPFTPETLRGSAFGAKWQPFLFLNACEVGRAGTALGQAGGFPGALLREGGRGFVGPLWQVDSGIARAIAVEFYQRTLKGEAVAAVLRDIRSRYVYPVPGMPPSPDTYLSYVFYGHPALRFTRQQ